MKAFNNIIIGLILIYFAAQTVGYDDSDDIFADKRSGMTPKTDYKTGCQYLQSPFGFALTPRLDGDGKPMCKSTQEGK